MISTRGRYALRMVIDLAQNQGDGYVSLKDIAERQDISKKYLEQIIMILNKSGILKTARGYQGGYRLSKSPDQVTVAEILKETENGLSPVACLQQSPNECPRCGECITLPVWSGLKDVMLNYLENITIQSIIDNYTVKGTDNYII